MIQRRKKQTRLEAAMSKASRAYWSYQEALTEEFKRLQEEKRLQFDNSEKRMGRPPVKLYILQQRALNKWLSALENYREIEKEEGQKEVDELRIIEYRRGDKAGRNKKDDVMIIKKYIRRQERDLAALHKEEREIEKSDGPGRPRQSFGKRLKIIQSRLDKSQQELSDILKTKSKHELLSYEILDLKNDRRAINIELKNAGERDAERLLKNRKSIDRKIQSLEKEREIEQIRERILTLDIKISAFSHDVKKRLSEVKGIIRQCNKYDELRSEQNELMKIIEVVD
ncbi:TPA: hypothetical protein KDY48_004577 [Vibrio parahaemolyticus]|nr:hypothetical protein [Vibrio parahaemolyticus]HBC3383660.1 hypothetical protein [Vibrio parahaemolyticus]HBC3445839.1 hypothetical protein [Vibrio parahaemolyticus]HBC3845865.1 hypothetical protein [Vibrio parahaemolyticus]HBH7861984.1 hypothetical protein [Vibrio parahaemolyticus]